MREAERRAIIEELKREKRDSIAKQMALQARMPEVEKSFRRTIARLRPYRRAIMAREGAQRYHQLVAELLKSLRNLRRMNRTDPLDWVEMQFVQMTEGMKLHMEKSGTHTDELEALEMGTIAMLELIAELRSERGL